MPGGFVTPMQKVPVPTMFPHKCACCGVAEYAKREFFIDSGITFDWDGTVYYCSECWKTLVRAGGGYTQEDFDAKISEYAERQRISLEDERELVVLRQFLDKLGIEPKALVELAKEKVPSVAELRLREQLAGNSKRTEPDNPSPEPDNSGIEIAFGIEPEEPSIGTVESESVTLVPHF